MGFKFRHGTTSGAWHIYDRSSKHSCQAQEGWRTVASAYDDVPVTTWPIALLSLRAHLEKLVTEGRVRHEGSRYAGVVNVVSEVSPS